MAEKKIVLIFGKRGSGKSYLANKLIEKEDRFLIFDTLSEYECGVVFLSEKYDELLLFGVMFIKDVSGSYIGH